MLSIKLKLYINNICFNYKDGDEIHENIQLMELKLHIIEILILIENLHYL